MSILDQPYNTSGACFGCCSESSNPFSDRSRSSHDENNQQLTGEDQQKKQEMDSIFVEAFKALTFEERQAQQEQLHGVADTLAEEPSLIENSLRELEFYLNRTKAGRVYETAERQNPSYVHSKNFRIMFLRADRYNAKAAADRMLRFFDEKQKLFGTEKLTKDITIDDLDEDDVVTVKCGCIQWAGRDRSNRPINLQLPGLRKFKELKNELRARFFIMMEAVKLPEAQLRGIVFICYTVGVFKDCRQGQGYLENNMLAEALPIYVAAFHFVVDDIKQYLIGTAAVTILSADVRARFRLHLGTHLESQYALSSYGISAAILPISPETNAVDMVPHLRWCERCISSNANQGIQQSLMPSAPSASVITEPNPNDVLSAGYTKSDNLGNDRVRELVKEYIEAYKAGSDVEKRHIVDGIIGEIHDKGGRFLQKKMGAQLWSELPISKARHNVSQRFRNHNRRRESASLQDLEGNLIADMPLVNDVIFGKHQERTNGTALFHHLINEKSEEYTAANRSVKVVVVDQIIERIQLEGGRFLQPSKTDRGRFVELSSADSIRDRITSYFRNHRRRMKKMATAHGP